MYRPDQLDWKIISLLNDNGRMSSAEIARQIGDISARTVTNRIDILIKHGIINIRAIVNPEKVGYGVLADVFIKVGPGNLRHVADTLADYPQITYVACATGDKDIVISVRAHDIQELYEFVIEVLGKIPGVQHTETYPMPLKIKSIATWMPPDVFEQEADSVAQDTHRPLGERDEK